MTKKELHWRKVLLFQRLAKHYDEEFLASYFKLPRREVARMKKEFSIVMESEKKRSRRASSLDEESVSEIIRLRQDGVSRYALARKFGVSDGVIRKIEKENSKVLRHRVGEDL